MKRKTTRLTFTEEELANPNIRRAAKKAARAAGRAEKAKAKLSTRAPPKRGLKMDTDKAKERSAQLRFGKAEFGEEIAKPKRRKPGAEALLGGEAHRQVDKQNQDENAGVQAAHEGERLAEGAAKKLKDGKYSKKLKAYKKAERLDKAADKANIQALRRKQQAVQPTSNPISRWKQRQQIKASYYARKTGSKMSGGAANTARSAATRKAKAAAAKAAQFASTHAHMLLMGGVLVLLILVIFCFITSCSVFFPGGTGTVWTTSYTAEDEDILGAEEDYCLLEEKLMAEIEAIPASHPGYDEYNFDLDPINHDPYGLAAMLTAIHEAYTRGEVQGTMTAIFDMQYELILTETIEIRTRTETRTDIDPATGETYTYEVEVEYEWKILNITLINYGIDFVAVNMLSGDDLERYQILQETQGNRPELFGGLSLVIGSDGSGEAGIDYQVPAEALTDPEFGSMLKEAEKYLGTPYVWGGSTPETGFDCSGYICWVLNQSGWDVGRTTANGLWQKAAKISEQEAKPGDLVFFEGTYDVAGASHVGIYVGNGMMISAGDPIKYSNIHSSYWDKHLLGFGRIPK
ncbi:hypothetical protein B5G12_12535 [Faecalibacterium sp. An58]|uniref:C40 family peptidase n=1 Tax=Faecalibacterium sp. An58 TaxID=1965648 RepID=UPI000B382296|nr:cell envelope integrity protein TolA [Faecalibacterium sp. An58]OUN68498.1 hypothetical protein B5G12_12535 [Faecalibacterium sp. An58]